MGDEPHVFCFCPSYVYAREQFQDLVQGHVTTVSQFVKQP